VAHTRLLAICGPAILGTLALCPPAAANPVGVPALTIGPLATPPVTFPEVAPLRDVLRPRAAATPIRRVLGVPAAVPAPPVDTGAPTPTAQAAPAPPSPSLTPPRNPTRPTPRRRVLPARVTTHAPAPFVQGAPESMNVTASAPARGAVAAAPVTASGSVRQQRRATLWSEVTRSAQVWWWLALCALALAARAITASAVRASRRRPLSAL
jgi:hypothetical protein